MKRVARLTIVAVFLSFTAPNMSTAQVADLAVIAETACSQGSSDDCISAILQLRRAMAAGPFPAAQLATVQRAMDAATQNIVRNPTTAAVSVAAEILTVANALPPEFRNPIASNLNSTVRNPDIMGGQFANMIAGGIVNAANAVVLGRVSPGSPVTVTGNFGAANVTAQALDTIPGAPAAGTPSIPDQASPS